VSSDTLYGLNRTTGAVAFQASLPPMVHFTSPSAGGGRLFVATGQTVNAFVIAKLPKPVVTITSPANGATVTSSTVTVTATVSDTVGVAKVSVNGSPATQSHGTWTAIVSGLKPGSNTLTATAV